MSDATRRPPYSHRVRVRYAETDQMGVVHHANYLLYLEDARTAVIRDQATAYGQLEATGVGLPVRHVDLRYRMPAFFEDELDVLVWVQRVRAASVTFAYEVNRKGGEAEPAVLATATVELACIDLKTRRPRLFPEGLKEAFQRSMRGVEPPAR